MSQNPLNLVVWFLLEIAALVAMGYWGWRQGHGFMRYVLALGVPTLAAALLGIFRVPDDPGPAPVAVPGGARLVLEVAYFAFAVCSLYVSSARAAAWTLGIVIVVRYAVSYDRIILLLKT